MKRLICASTATALLLGAIGALTQTADAVTETPTAQVAAVQVGAMQIATGTTASYVIAADGKPYGAGDNGAGELTGTGPRPTLTAMTGLPAGVRATGIAGGYDHSVVLGSNGVPYASGANLQGQLTGTAARKTLTPMAGLPAGVKATAVAAGGDHSLVLGSNGVPYGAGGNAVGQLTGASGLNKVGLIAMTGLPVGVKATAIATSPNDSLVLGSNGVAYGAGRNLEGQLTVPGSSNQTVLVPLGGLPAEVKATAISSGYQFSLVLGSDGAAYGAGSNANSQLSGFGNKNLLARVLGMPGAVKTVRIAAGGYHSVAIGTDGVPYAVGYNHDGELTGTQDGNKSALTAMTGLPSGVKAKQVAGNEYTSLVLGSDNAVYGTGGNEQAQLTGTGPAKKYTLTSFTGQVLVLASGATLSGPVRVGRKIAATGNWLQTPSTYAYQWRRNGAAVAGAIKSTYTPTVADLHKLLSATITVSRNEFVTAIGTTGAVRIGPGAALKLVAAKKPVVSGPAKVGKTLRIRNVTRSGWSPVATKLGFRWYRGSKPIKGATHTTYRVSKADKGQRIRVRIYGQRTAFATGTYLTTTTPKVKG